MTIFWLDDPRAQDAQVVGGKAATLARLRARHNIPLGFCVTSPDADIAAAYAELVARSGSAAVAVRSSGVGEDSAEASFAGQHDTLLNVVGAEAVAEGVRRCWASVTSDHASAYRARHGIADETPRFAVLVQRMVPADAAAYAFSVDPVSGQEDVVVNVVSGLGEGIASGEATPDHYRVDRRSLAIAERTPSGAAPVLSDDDVREIAHLALTLEREMGYAVDMECAFAQGQLHLLQCRPVTAKATAVVWEHPDDAGRTWLLDAEHGSAPFPPLASDAVLRTVNHGLRREFERGNGRSGGRFSFRNGYAYWLSVRNPDESPAELQARFAPLLRVLSGKVRRYWDEQGAPTLRDTRHWLRALRIDRLRGGEVVAAWDELWTRIAEAWDVHFQVIWGTYAAIEDFVAVRAALIPEADEHESLTIVQGQSVDLLQVDRDLHALVRRTRELGQVPQDELSAFLERHGHLGQTGLDLTGRTWWDERDVLAADIERKAREGTEDPEVRRARLGARREEIGARDREALHKHPDELRRYDEALSLAVSVAALAEDHNYWIDRMTFGHARRVALEVGRHLVAAGAFRSADDVFFLDVGEVRELLATPRDATARIDERRGQHARNLTLRPPAYVGPPFPELLPSTPDGAAKAESGSLRGVGASAGLARGTARIVRSTADFGKVGRGDVVVCRNSNQSFVPLFTLAAGIVTEFGGMLSHASVCAREFGLPAVVGVSGVLDRIADGALVELDGRTGAVTLLSG
jgi:rifampicin phosphotransferase